MRIALNATGELGKRVGQILLAEAGLVALGLYGHQGRRSGDRRTIPIETLEGFDLLVTDDPTPSAIAGIAAEDGLGCVVPTGVTEETADRFVSTPLVTEASLPALASALASHEAARVEGVANTRAWWSIPGKPLRKGIGVAFPEPIGARWGEPSGSGVAVPLSGQWAGVAAAVTGEIDGVSVERIVGAADYRNHLEALVLAAAAIAAAEGAYPAGSSPADAAPEELLEVALRAGLGVAAFTSEHA